MKKYKSLSSNYVKKNTFINNTLGYYRKPIFISLLAVLIVAICTLLIVQVTNIERSEREKTVVVIDRANNQTELDEAAQKYEQMYPQFEFIFLNSRVYQYDTEAISDVQKHNIEKIGVVNGYMIFKHAIVLYDEIGRHKGTYYHRSNPISVLKEKGWI